MRRNCCAPAIASDINCGLILPSHTETTSDALNGIAVYGLQQSFERRQIVFDHILHFRWLHGGDHLGTPSVVFSLLLHLPLFNGSFSFSLVSAHCKADVICLHTCSENGIEQVKAGETAFRTCIDL